REAARIVNTQLSAAQSQALANGRSAGLWIERLPGDVTGSMDLYLAEVPPPYSGDQTSSRATVNASSTVETNATVTFPSTDTGWYGLLKPGDLIRFNYGGPLYQLTGKNEQPAGSGNFQDATQEDPPNSGVKVLKEDNSLAFQIVPTNAGSPDFNLPPAAYAA